jgi:hypothetical protein
MVSRPSPDTLESLRITLQKLEHGIDSMLDAAAMAELKRTILLRIAELEAANAVQHVAVVEPVDTSSPSASPPLRTDDAA